MARGELRFIEANRHEYRCTDIDSGECCGHFSDRADSALFVSLPPTGIGMLHQPKPGAPDDHCGGKIFASGIGGCISNSNGIVHTKGSTWDAICGTMKRGEQALNRRQCNKRSSPEEQVKAFLDMSYDDQTAHMGKCKRSVRPDILTLSDGTSFDIGTNVSREDIEQLMELARSKSNATGEDVPEHLQFLVIKVQE